MLLRAAESAVREGGRERSEREGGREDCSRLKPRAKQRERERERDREKERSGGGAFAALLGAAAGFAVACCAKHVSQPELHEVLADVRSQTCLPADKGLGLVETCAGRAPAFRSSSCTGPLLAQKGVVLQRLTVIG